MKPILRLEDEGSEKSPSTERPGFHQPRNCQKWDHYSATFAEPRLLVAVSYRRSKSASTLLRAAAEERRV